LSKKDVLVTGNFVLHKVSGFLNIGSGLTSKQLLEMAKKGLFNHIPVRVNVAQGVSYGFNLIFPSTLAGL
jgi:hypothetical protein